MYYSYNSPNVKQVYDSLYLEDDEFFKVYIERVLKFGEVSSKTALSNFTALVNDPMVNNILKFCVDIEKDSQLINKLRDAFFKYAEIFSPSNVPVIYLIYSAFSYNVIALPKRLGISLERYIQNDNIYDIAQIPKYERIKMKKEYLPYDAIKGWILSDINMDSVITLLDHMIIHGKVLFLLDQIFGEGNDHLKIGYSLEQLKWCEKNKTLIWSFFVESKILHSSKYEYIAKYINPAPFAQGISKECPGEVGKWIGWQIVKSYCKNHDCSPPQLLTTKNDLIFRNSGFKP